MPALREDAFAGGIRYYDAQMDDSRFLIAVLRTAVEHGAVCASGARVTRVLREGERVVGARVADVESGREVDLRRGSW